MITCDHLSTLLIREPGNAIVPFFGPQAKKISPHLVEPNRVVMGRATRDVAMPGLLKKDGQKTLGLAISSSKVNEVDEPRNFIFDKKKIEMEIKKEKEKQKEKQKQTDMQQEKKKQKKKEQKEKAKAEEKEEDAIVSVRIFLSLSDQRRPNWESTSEFARSK